MGWWCSQALQAKLPSCHCLAMPVGHLAVVGTAARFGSPGIPFRRMKGQARGCCVQAGLDAVICFHPRSGQFSSLLLSDQ